MRIARRSVPDVLTHIICRFVDRSWLLRDNAERAKYLALFGRALAKSDWRCVAYALMSSHLHFAMLPGKTKLLTWARSVNSSFARWLNARHDRLGPVMADRPSEWVRWESQADLIAYIHNNPVTAKVVKRASSSRWTSHRAYIGKEKAPSWLEVHVGMAICGLKSTDHTAFDDWINATSTTVTYPGLATMRRAAREYGDVELATPIVRETTEVPLVAHHSAVVRPSMKALVQLTAEAAGLTVGDLCTRSRRPAGVAGRRIVAQVARRLGKTNAEIARALGVSLTSINKYLAYPLSEPEMVVAGIVEDRAIATSTCNWPGR